MLERFAPALNSGEYTAIALLADDVEAIRDGGGKVPAAAALRGGGLIARAYVAQMKQFGTCREFRLINGESGILRYTDGRLDAAQAELPLQVEALRRRPLEVLGMNQEISEWFSPNFLAT